MKFLTVAALAGAAVAYPGMKGPRGAGGDHHAGIFKAIIERANEKLLEERQQPPAQPFVPIGNIQPSGQGGTPVNDRIYNCLTDPRGVSCVSTEQYTPPVRDTPACAADTCCIWSYIKDDLVPLMRETDGTCNDFARNAVRFGFHDAGAWEQTSTHGGADGSLLLEDSEVSRPANFGLELSKNILGPIYERYRSYGISAADLVQFAHNVAVVVCPLGPRSLTYVGRPDWQAGNQPNEDGLLPDARDTADNLLSLFSRKTIGTVDLVALLGAHTSAKQFHFDTARAGQPLDTTPGVWDVAFYAEVLNGTTPCGVFRLPSDDSMGNHATARNGFINMSNGFPSDTSVGQILWNGLYSKAYLRLSLLGVANIQGLTDCTKVLPNEITTFQKPPSAIVSCPNPSSSSILSSATSSIAPPASSSVRASSAPPSSFSSVIASERSSSSGVVPPVSSSPASVRPSSSPVSARDTSTSVSASAPVLPSSRPASVVPSSTISRAPSSSSRPGGNPAPTSSRPGNGGNPSPTSSKPAFMTTTMTTTKSSVSTFWWGGKTTRSWTETFPTVVPVTPGNGGGNNGGNNGGDGGNGGSDGKDDPVSKLFGLLNALLGSLFGGKKSW